MDGPSLGAGAETATGDITLDGIGAALEAGVQSLAKVCQPEHYDLVGVFHVKWGARISVILNGF
jgi:hypothetical protein